MFATGYGNTPLDASCMNLASVVLVVAAVVLGAAAFALAPPGMARVNECEF